MARIIKNITQTLIIPSRSRERFIHFRTPESARWWFGNGVGLAGISHLSPGYLVDRPQCGHHFLAYVTGGAVSFRIGGEDRELTRGAFVFLQAGTLHHYETNRRLSMIWFHVDPRHSRWGYLAETPSFHRPSRCLASLAPLMERAFAESQSPRSDGVREALCRLILAYLDRELEQSEASAAKREQLEKVWREVSRDLARPWDIASLARMAGMSPSHFHAVVAAVYGLAPMQIVRNLRMSHIQALLLNTGEKLENIAERTGYQSAFSLSRAFKEYQGVSPQRYRTQSVSR